MEFRDAKSDRALSVYSSLGISPEGTMMVYSEGELAYVAYKCHGNWFFCDIKWQPGVAAVSEGTVKGE